MRRPLLIATLLTAACKVEEAPATTDELFHRLWSAFPVEAEADMDLLIGSVPANVDLDTLVSEDWDNAPRGNQTHLSPDEIAGLPFEDADGNPLAPPDPSLATPLYLIDRFPCDGATLEAILTYPDQNALYKTYDGYERRFESDRDAFLDGSTDTLGWDGTIEVASVISYVQEFHTDLRRVTVGEDAGVPGDTVWITRNVLPRPAEWKGSDGYFKQDYQLELFMPVPGGDLVHLYPVWREMKAAGSTLDDPILRGINFSQTISFDKTTARLCAEGVPAL